MLNENQQSAFSTSNQFLRRGSWIRRANDRPAHHNIAGAGGERIAGAHRPLLVVLAGGSSSSSTNTGCHNHGRGVTTASERRRLLRRRHHAVESRRLRQL